MASIFTGLAFMHGHIVDRELVLKLGREENAVPGKGVPRAATASPRKHSAGTTCAVPTHQACATC